MAQRRVLFIGFLASLMLSLLAACATREPTSVRTINDSDVIYGDDFAPESTGQWLIEADEHGATFMQDSRMMIEVGAANSLQYTALEEPTFADFDLVVDVELIEGDRDATYGLLFRMIGPEEFYRFELTGDGRYIVERRDSDGSWQRLTNGWQKSEAIIGGAGAVNRVRVVAEGPSMTFYANDELLAEIQDSRYGAGKVALDAGTFGGQRTVAAFDNLAVRAP